MTFRKIIICFFIAISVSSLSARERTSFDGGWLFTLNPADTALYRADVADSHWRKLDLPHDWAIEGNFSAANPSGASGGALPGGIGWYRKHFAADIAKGERLLVDFDGVYMNSTVWINGHRLGTRPYGYSSFRYDLTPFIVNGDNVIAVKVDNSEQPNSRWYSGCGIYRHVWLTKVSALHIAHWGVGINSTLSKGDGLIAVDLTLEGIKDEQPSVSYTVYDKEGKQVARKSYTWQQLNTEQCGQGSERCRLRHRVLTVRHPRLWSPASPYTYTVRTEVIVGGKTVDEVTTRTGFRSFRFDATTGFWLNGKNMKLNGVCEHHDLGCLGAAFNEDAMRRKLVRLKAMGVNALRCTHNPPAPQLLDLCDTMGFVVMDESFDMWRTRKSKYDYARYFDEWHERDLTDMVLRDRNHPSVIVWSIGNEVLEQWSQTPAIAKGEGEEMTVDDANIILNRGQAVNSDDGAAALARHLASIVRKLDPTRPITAGCNEPSPKNNLFRSGALDIVGFNYHHLWVKDVPKNFPGKPFVLTESVSALATRGYYRMPSDSMLIMPDSWDKPFADPSMMCSAYDNCHVPWGSTHEETWDVVKNTPWCAGQFLWTGFDYIGEPTPYGFPARSSYFGVIDLAGFPKDSYYLYQSEWTAKPVLHLLPHWNWNAGDTVDVWCYYNNADSVELFVNGKSQGVRSKKDHQYHVSWRVKYEPGEIKAVARGNSSAASKEGGGEADAMVKTAGSACSIRLTKDYDGTNTLFVMAEVIDKEGNLCPWADDDITFSVDGGTVIGVDNGSPFSMESFKANHRKAFFGKALVVIKKNAANITVSARSPMLKPTTAVF